MTVRRAAPRHGGGSPRGRPGPVCGAANPDFVARLEAGDRGGDSPASPRMILRTYYVADPASLGADEEPLLDTVLSTATGEGDYPGDAVACDDWPGEELCPPQLIAGRARGHPAPPATPSSRTRR
ncbi:hypothetical protein ACFOWE_30240 [Planomonospora corallina]|uniref:Uncharacterized protein n=1 Tax=Planomonospora corallina TaxID=1806052 RepID=A0ABV8IFE3_9ACTN